MAKIIEFPKAEPVITIERSEKFINAAYAAAEFIEALPLSAEQYDTLLELISNQIIAAERGAFAQGLHMGLDISKAKK